MKEYMNKAKDWDREQTNTLKTIQDHEGVVD